MARTPMSLPGSSGSLLIRKTKAQIRRLSPPSGFSSCDSMISWKPALHLAGHDQVVRELIVDKIRRERPLPMAFALRHGMLRVPHATAFSSAPPYPSRPCCGAHAPRNGARTGSNG